MRPGRVIGQLSCFLTGKCRGWQQKPPHGQRGCRSDEHRTQTESEGRWCVCVCCFCLSIWSFKCFSYSFMCIYARYSFYKKLFVCVLQKNSPPVCGILILVKRALDLSCLQPTEEEKLLFLRLEQRPAWVKQQTNQNHEQCARCVYVFCEWVRTFLGVGQ